MASSLKIRTLQIPWHQPLNWRHELDLSAQPSIRTTAAALLQLTPVVDVLTNNAGVMILLTYTTASSP
jgi:NAD(P)-dependent dehydrogenase (short-subunit alcohol dehydrogenase family)